MQGDLENNWPYYVWMFNIIDKQRRIMRWIRDIKIRSKRINTKFSIKQIFYIKEEGKNGKKLLKDAIKTKD